MLFIRFHCAEDFIAELELQGGSIQDDLVRVSSLVHIEGAPLMASYRVVASASLKNDRILKLEHTYVESKMSMGSAVALFAKRGLREETAKRKRNLCNYCCLSIQRRRLLARCRH